VLSNWQTKLKENYKLKKISRMELLFHFLRWFLFFFLATLLTTLIGALTGLIAGWLLGKTFLAILATLGIEGFKMWQIGAFLGFVGSFFRTTNFTLQKKN